jgi:hypothetical protein
VENHQIHLKHFAFAVQKSAKLKKWTSKEVNGLIFIWHHVDNQNPWELKFFKQIESREWVFYGKNEYVINCHIQDIPENGADVCKSKFTTKDIHFQIHSIVKLISKLCTVHQSPTVLALVSLGLDGSQSVVIFGMQSEIQIKLYRKKNQISIADGEQIQQKNTLQL